VFGVWLALHVGGSELCNGWIHGALALFGATAVFGARARSQALPLLDAVGRPSAGVALAAHAVAARHPRPDGLEAGRVSALAATRPDDWNVALFIHVLGALTPIGALVTAASFLFAARREASLALTRADFRSLLIVALPAFIATRVGGE
jgi:hypothetical protein